MSDKGLYDIDGLIEYVRGIQFGTNPTPGNIPIMRTIDLQDIIVILELLSWWEKEINTNR